jgi:single-strand DNA-binding protein
MLNKAMLIGNLGADPTMRRTQSGLAVCNFDVATSERWKDKNGQQQQSDEWHRVVAWKNLAEACGEYLHKGSKVYVEGRLQTRKWQDQNSNDRYTTEIVATDVQFLTPKGGGGGSGAGNQGRNSGGYSHNTDNYGTGSDVPF